MRAFTPILVLTLSLSMLLFYGCTRKPEDGPGGLTERDFVKVSENGFDAADQAQDLNDYP